MLEERITTTGGVCSFGQGEGLVDAGQLSHLYGWWIGQAERTWVGAKKKEREMKQISMGHADWLAVESSVSCSFW